MTQQNQKRVPFLLGPNWQGVSAVRESAAQAPSIHAPSFHASLRDCARDLEKRPETESVKSAALEQRASQSPQLHLTLLKQLSSWLSAKSLQAAKNNLQAVEPVTLDNCAPRAAAATRPQSSVLAHIWSWLQTKYASSSTKRLRVAEMVPLGEKRFLAVVTVEGREFLVGGGASGVSVVTQLDAARNSAIAPRRELEFQGAIE